MRPNYNRKGHITHTRNISEAPISGDLEDYVTKTYKTPTSESPHNKLEGLPNTEANTKKIYPIDGQTHTKKEDKNTETNKYALNERTGEIFRRNS